VSVSKTDDSNSKSSERRKLLLLEKSGRIMCPPQKHTGSIPKNPRYAYLSPTPAPGTPSEAKELQSSALRSTHVSRTSSSEKQPGLSKGTEDKQPSLSPSPFKSEHSIVKTENNGTASDPFHSAQATSFQSPMIHRVR